MIVERDAPTRRLEEQSPDRLGPGDIIGDWTIVRLISQGGFGAVYEARTRDGRGVAIKLLHSYLTGSRDACARFQREAALIERLRHPNVVELVAARETPDGQPYLCMELLDGEDLGRVLARGPLTPDAALDVLAPVCDALAAAHEIGIVHRDVKATNVVRCADRVVLLDFGIAKLCDSADALTQSNQRLGTPTSMAPEQIRGGAVDARTDVYAAGTLAFHMLTGHVPFEESSPTMMQYLHVHARRPRVSAYVPVDERVDEIIARAMAIRPDDRFADPRAFAAALRSAFGASGDDAQIVEAATIVVAARDRGDLASLDEVLLADLEGILPLAEALFAKCGIRLVADLGSSAVFVTRAPAAVASDVVAVWEQLAIRPRRDARVIVTIAIRIGPVAICGGSIELASVPRVDPDFHEHGAWLCEPAGPRRLA